MKMSRQQSVDHFQSKQGFNAIIMSPLAAGVGLNITEANHVIHYSRWWNPAKEDQASDRVYRIGQKRPVHIYLPIATHPEFQTFDVILNELLERKRQLSQGTLFPTEQVEVTPKEVLEKLQLHPFGNQKGTPLTIVDVDNLDPELFEIFIAALFEKQGYTTEHTPYSGDKGADVVAFQNENRADGLLIQAKQRKADTKPGSEAIDEVIAAKSFYEEKHGITFTPAVITNRKFNRTAQRDARNKQVTVYERKWIKKSLEKYGVTHMDIDKFKFQAS